LKFFRYLFAGALFLFCAVPGNAADPEVSNVQIAQRTDGTGLVDVTYDVQDTDGDELAITLRFSADGGATWEFPVLFTSGDIGESVTPGPGKHIVCDFGQIAEGVVTEQMQTRILASDLGVLFPPHSPRHVAVMQLGLVDWTDEELLEQYSRTDLMIMTASDIWTGSDAADYPVVDRLKELNPDLEIVGYVSGFSAKLYAEHSAPDTFWYQWFHRTRPYWVWTTEGDTAQTWPGNAVINIIDPECRRLMIETVMEFQASSLNKMDGVYWDYFNNWLWVYPELDVQGEIDMDDDGIGHRSDQDEMIAFRAAQVSLVSALRDSLGEGFLQVFNGQRAYGDEAFANLADGVMYELFPTLFFPEPNLRTALDPEYENNLFNVRSWLRTQNGDPYVIMSNPQSLIYFDHNSQPTQILTGNQFRAVALLIDGYSCWNSHDGSSFSYTYGWTDNDIAIGQPLGPPTYDGDFIRRDFQYGRVELELTSGIYPDPYDYRIWALGTLVEELSIPFHYP